MQRTVPVLDARRLDAGALDAACRAWGLFHVDGHGIEPTLCRELLAQSRAFFAQPLERKRAVERTAANTWGFYDRELTKNARDWKEIFDVGPSAGGAGEGAALAGTRPQWPPDLPGFQPALEGFASACEEVAFRLLRALSRALGQPGDALDPAFAGGHTSFLRLNHYPRCPDPAPPDAATVPAHGALGIHHHTDAGALTLLLQDEQPGLQVWHEDAWHTVMPRPGALLCNVGDVVQVWSNDRYPAPLHRVLASAEAERYSAAWFFNPAYETDYAPLSGPPRYRPINWGAFRAGRAAGDYADQGHEIQIADFRIG